MRYAGITDVWFLDGKDTASQNVLNSLANGSPASRMPLWPVTPEALMIAVFSPMKTLGKPVGLPPVALS